MSDVAKVGRVQDDFSDIDVVEMAAATSEGFIKTPPPVGGVTVFGGKVEWRSLERDELRPCLDGGRVRVVESMVARWPQLLILTQRIMQAFYPVWAIPPFPPKMFGCVSGPVKFGHIYVTVDDEFGCAEGIAHELAHQKLASLGVWLTKWDNLVANEPDEEYVSPIRKDALRPMGAVLHAQYAYLHVLNMALRSYALESDEFVRGRLPANIRRYRKVVVEGHEILESNLRTDADGEGFYYAMREWTQELLDESVI
jgi:hypothetical protein